MTPTEQRRAEFEAWIGLAGMVLTDAEIDVLRDAWQAAADLGERRGLERAREICLSLCNQPMATLTDGTVLTAHQDARMCADAIEREIGE